MNSSNAPVRTVERLGAVSCPSGVLLVLDGGLAWIWSHDRPPLLPEWSEVAGVANAAVDLEVQGPDALEAGRALDVSNHPLFIYDQPLAGLEKIKRAFDSLIRERELDATLHVAQARIPHRRRVDLALECSVGIVDFHGMWAGAIAGVPRDKSLHVLGERMPPGPDAGRWRRVWISLREDVASERSPRLGHVLVDEARLMVVDADALGSWDDHNSLDGMGDIVFWGADAAWVARELGANEIRLPGEDGLFGWTDLPLDDAIERGERVEAYRAAGRRFAFDFRPHTHHWQVMRDVRAAPTESGVLRVGGADLCVFMTSWGDGAFPIEVDLDCDGRPVRLRVELGTEEIVQRQRSLEER
ncbi:MAG: hypothetical protein ACYC8T_14555 [Myxococcaceae bacterium]